MGFLLRTMMRLIWTAVFVGIVLLTHLNPPLWFMVLGGFVIGVIGGWPFNDH